MLRLKGIHTFFGISHILHGVSLNVGKGEIVCLLGRNGVGKSTILKSIMGLVRPQQGTVIFDGEEILGKPIHKIACKGISYVPEDRRIFPMLTVEENLLMGAKMENKGTSVSRKTNLKKIYNYFPKLSMRKGQMGGLLSGGEQQMLTIARGLMGGPKLMLLDEPCEGLAPIIVKELIKIISVLCREEHLTMLMVEQNFHVALTIADRGYVLEKGAVTFAGDSEDMRESEEVKKRCGIC